MRILVTGATGMLGSTLVPFLIDKGYSVLRHGCSQRGEFRCDLTKRAEALSMIAQVNPDIVVNLVAMTDVDACEVSPHDAYLRNVRTVENLVAGMAYLVNPFMVHLSTDHLYDSPGPDNEGGICLRNIYALTKYAGELAAAAVPSTIIRTNFFGMSRVSGRLSLSDWVINSLKHGEKITVFDDVVFSPLSMTTLCECVDRVMCGRITGTFNLGSSDSMSKADFAFVLAKALDLPVRHMRRGSIAELNFRAYRPRDMAMDSTLFEKTFGLRLPDLEQEIEKTYRRYDG